MTIETFAIGDRAAWLARRQRDVTASVAGALLGVHEYVSAYGLWALKSGILAEDPEETPAMRRGRLLEPVALDLLREEHPEIRFERGAHYLRDTEARIGATPDAIAHCPKRGRGVVQIKSVEPSIFRRKWRTSDNDFEAVTEPPLWIVVQAIVEAKLSGADWAAVAPMRVAFGLDIELVEIPIHDPIYARLCGLVAEFWQRVEAKEPYPADYAKDGELLAGFYADDNGLELDLSADNRMPSLLEERAELKASIKATAEAVKLIDTEIVAKLGSYERAYVPGWRVSRPTVHRRGYEVASTTYRKLDIRPIR